MKRLTYHQCLGCILFVILLLPIGNTLAQPEQITTAINSLSQAVGTSLSITDLENWTWSQDLYPDTSLGCPQPDQVYAQVQTAGYTFELTYGGIIYEYRVSADSAIVFLCNTKDANAPTPTPSLEEQYNNSLCPPPDEGKLPYMRSRLVDGVQGRGVAPNTPITASAAPGAEVVAQLPVGGEFEVLAAPVCNESKVWWQITFNSLTGWIPEGEEGTYFVEPLPPNPLQNRAAITANNATQFVELDRLQGNFMPYLAWSADGSTLAVPSGLGSDSLWLFSYPNLEQPPRIIEDDERFTSVDFGTSNEQVLLGTASGKAKVVNTAPDANLIEALFLTTHERDVTQVTYSADGASFAAAGTNASTTADVDKSFAILVWDIATVSQTGVLSGHSGPVTDMAFSLDGSRLASIGTDNTLMIWDLASATSLAQLTIGTGSRSIAYSPNGQFNAVGAANGTVTLFDLNSGQSIAVYAGHAGSVSQIAFSPDSSLLVSISDDQTMRLWSTTADTPLMIAQLDTPIRDVAFHPNGDLLTLAGEDNTIRLWGVPSA